VARILPRVRAGGERQDSMKRIEGESTGIYRAITLRAETRADEKELVRRAAGPRSFNRDIVAPVRDAALEVLRQRGVTERGVERGREFETALRIIRATTGAIHVWGDPAKLDPVGRDAREALITIEAIENAQAAGDWPAMAWHSFALGRVAERMGVRGYEPLTKRGRKELADSQLGGRNGAATRQKRRGGGEYQSPADCGRALLVEFNQWRRANPGVKLAAGYRAVAEQFRLHPDSARRLIRQAARPH
jgi:hypothetical protein